jgi:AhpD family alkylhydroperoxidase
MYAVMANSPGLLETYATGYAAFREASGFTPAEQEVVLLTVSHENGCEYCVAAHSFLADQVSS